MPTRDTAINTDEIIRVGGQYAVTGRYRHPSFSSLIVDSKNGRGVFDIEKVGEMLQAALLFVEECGKKRKPILFVSTRQETVDVVKSAAESTSLPYMLNRWIGGTLSNFKNIQGRVVRMKKMRKDRDEGGWGKHTKKEQVLLNRELAKLENKFLGISSLETLPAAIFILDTRKEKVALNEANDTGIPVIGFSNADADLRKIQYPIVANIYSRDTVKHILNLVQQSYESGLKNAGESENESGGESGSATTATVADADAATK